MGNIPHDPSSHHWTSWLIILSREILFLTFQIPFGVIVGAIIERISRSISSNNSRLRNNAIKIVVAHVSVSFLLGNDITTPFTTVTFWPNGWSNHDDDGLVNKEHTIRVGIMAFLVMRLCIFLIATIIGAAIQPVGLTGGIATGKSTVSSLLLQSKQQQQQQLLTAQSQSSVLPKNKKQNTQSDNVDDDGYVEEAEFVIIDVDKIAHDILLPKTMLATSKANESVYDRLVSEFGTEILMNDDDDDDDTTNTNTSNDDVQTKTDTATTDAADATTSASISGNRHRSSNSSHHTPNIDRRKLGDIVFRDKTKRRKLNSITHPTIIKIMLKRIFFEGISAAWQCRLSLKPPPKAKGMKHHHHRRRRRVVVCVDIPLLFEGGLPMQLLFGSTILVVACNPTLQLQRLHSRNPDLTLEQCRQRIASQIPVEKKAARAHVVIRNDTSLDELRRRVGEVKEFVGGMTYDGEKRGVELEWLIGGFGLFFLVLRCL